MTTKQYRCQINLNLYDAANCKTLATQAAVGRHLRIIDPELDQLDQLNHLDNYQKPVQVELCEDNYPGWLQFDDIKYLEPTTKMYQATVLSTEEIQQRIPQAIAFTQAAMQQMNHYLWGGTVAPNYDCSGLMQAAFASVGIQIPRDAYQQEAFTEKIAIEELQSGDLVFFGPPEKATHVGLYLGDGHYIHSSCQETGRNGIAIDVLSATGDVVTQHYYRQLRGAGRVICSYQPQDR
jgi:cell wall-associated NlpC family hydrolase